MINRQDSCQNTKLQGNFWQGEVPNIIDYKIFNKRNKWEKKRLQLRNLVHKNHVAHGFLCTFNNKNI